MATERSFAVTPRLIVGLTVLALGVAFLLDEMGRFEARQILRFWPLALIVLGLTSVVQARETAGRLFGGVAAFVGLWFLFDNLGWIDSNPFILLKYFWPVTLLAAGGMLVWRSLRGPRPAVAAARSSDKLNAFALLSGVVVSSASQTFVGGSATAVLGGCDIDLRQAKLEGDEAVIDVFAIWGGIEIKVPPTWEIVGKVAPLMAGFEIKAATPPPGGPRLVVTGSAIMGGVEVHN